MKNKPFILLTSVLLLTFTLTSIASTQAKIDENGNWVIVITDSTGAPIQGAKVFLFSGGGGIETASMSIMNTTTNFNGEALFPVTGFYRVGVLMYGYTSADSTQMPLAEWVTVWSVWGAGGAGSDYTIRLTPSSISPQAPYTPPTPTPTPPPFLSISEMAVLVVTVLAITAVSVWYLKTKKP
ncbi:MAG: carboxypeptidase-like regulatory domain-containing protein [Candidatus Bathyarchaeia archaeon]